MERAYPGVVGTPEAVKSQMFPDCLTSFFICSFGSTVSGPLVSPLMPLGLVLCSPTLLPVLTGWAAWLHATADELTTAPGLRLEKRLELGGSSRSMSDRPPIPFLVSEFVVVLHQGSAVPRFPVLWYLF